MVPFEKVSNRARLCAIELDFDGYTLPSTIEGYQPFYNSIPVQGNFRKFYTGKGSMAFKEEPTQSNSGTSYKQKVIFKFPSNDKYRSERIDMFRKVKNVKLIFTDKSALVIGRNDYFQNVRPNIDFNSDANSTSVEISQLSIFPAGFIPHQGAFALPAFLPLTLLNLN